MEERKKIGNVYFYKSENVRLEKFLDFKKVIVMNIQSQIPEVVLLSELKTKSEETSSETVMLDSISDKDVTKSL
jgi:hypothetical protein